MKNDLTIIRLNPETHAEEIEMFLDYRKNNRMENAKLPAVFGSLLKDYNRLLKFESDFKNDLVGIKLSSREAQKQGYLMLTVLNTFLYENEFGLSMPLFLNDQKSEMLRKVEFNYDQWIKELQIKAENKRIKSQSPLTSAQSEVSSDNNFSSLPNDLFS